MMRFWDHGLPFARTDVCIAIPTGGIIIKSESYRVILKCKIHKDITLPHTAVYVVAGLEIRGEKVQEKYSFSTADLDCYPPGDSGCRTTICIRRVSEPGHLLWINRGAIVVLKVAESCSVGLRAFTIYLYHRKIESGIIYIFTYRP